MTSNVALRCFSLAAEVRTDVPEVARYTRDLFRRFVVDAVPDPGYVLSIETAGVDRWRIADPEIEGVVDDAGWLTGVVAARLLEAAGNRVTEHDLFHGAALEGDGHGLLICGPSGHGKSTLALELLERGMRFLSDEVGVVADDGELLPFPKALELRPGSGAVELPPGGTPGRAGKLLQDVESLRPGALGEACPLTHVVFLESAAPTQRDAGRVSVTFHRRDDRLPGTITRMEGVLAVAWASVTGATLDLRVDPARFAAWTLPEAAARHGVLVVDSSAEARRPDFDGEPELEPLPVYEGVRRLLGQFRGTRALPNRIAAHRDGFGGVFLSFVDRLARVRFARLGVGRLAAELDLLATLVNPRPTP